jgi:hypothetical protein
VAQGKEDSGEMAVLGRRDGGQLSVESVVEKHVENWAIGMEAWRAFRLGSWTGYCTRILRRPELTRSTFLRDYGYSSLNHYWH